MLDWFAIPIISTLFSFKIFIAGEEKGYRRGPDIVSSAAAQCSLKINKSGNLHIGTSMDIG